MNPKKTLSEHILEFVNMKATSPTPKFFSNDLLTFIKENSSFYPAPGSADRIMRRLRQEGKLNYNVVERKQSLYEALPIAVTPEEN
jgi:hypothetical protein